MTFRVCITFALFCFLTIPATFAGVMVVVQDPIQGPNTSVTATANAFFGNVIDSLGGATVPANDDDPAGLGTLSPPYLYSRILATTFPSWNGSADDTPGWEDGATVTGAFSAQLGNTAYVPVIITTDANDKVALVDIQASLRWTDPLGMPSSIFAQEVHLCGVGPDCNGDGDLSNDNVLLQYSQENVGVIDDDMDGLLETNGDDTLVTSGSATQQVDGLLMVGLADRVAFSGLVPDGTDQENIDEALSRLSTIGRQDMTVTFSISSQNSDTDSDSVVVPFVVPEPQSLIGVLIASLVVLSSVQRAANG